MSTLFGLTLAPRVRVPILVPNDIGPMGWVFMGCLAVLMFIYVIGKRDFTRKRRAELRHALEQLGLEIHLFHPDMQAGGHALLASGELRGRALKVAELAHEPGKLSHLVLELELHGSPGVSAELERVRPWWSRELDGPERVPTGDAQLDAQWTTLAGDPQLLTALASHPQLRAQLLERLPVDRCSIGEGRLRCVWAHDTRADQLGELIESCLRLCELGAPLFANHHSGAPSLEAPPPPATHEPSIVEMLIYKAAVFVVLLSAAGPAGFSLVVHEYLPEMLVRRYFALGGAWLPSIVLGALLAIGMNALGSRWRGVKAALALLGGALGAGGILYFNALSWMAVTELSGLVWLGAVVGSVASVAYLPVALFYVLRDVLRASRASS